MVRLNTHHANAQVLRRFGLSHVLTKHQTSSYEPINLALVGGCVDYAATTALNTLDGYGQIAEVLLAAQRPSPPLVSDVDEQLILKVFFREPVTVYAVQIDCGQEPEDCDAAAPRTVHVYANRPEFDFNEADAVTPHQTLDLADEEAPQKHLLRGTKFDRVTSLQLFVVDNVAGSERTFVSKLTIWGSLQRPRAEIHLL